MDFAGPFLGKMYLVVVDSHSKWPKVFEMSSTSSEQTVCTLHKLFASYGLPLQLVSDNGPQFTSSCFEQFMKGNGVSTSVVPLITRSQTGWLNDLSEALRKP